MTIADLTARTATLEDLLVEVRASQKLAQDVAEERAHALVERLDALTDALNVVGQQTDYLVQSFAPLFQAVASGNMSALVSGFGR